jgi:hypothetical protein
LLGPGDEAGQGVQVDGGVAEPVAGAQPGEGVDRLERRVGARRPGAGQITESDLKPRWPYDPADYSRLLGCGTLRLGRLRMALLCVA